jgi:hypothetical protein
MSLVDFLEVFMSHFLQEKISENVHLIGSFDLKVFQVLQVTFCWYVVMLKLPVFRPLIKDGYWKVFVKYSTAIS